MSGVKSGSGENRIRILLNIVNSESADNASYVLIGDFSLSFLPNPGWTFTPDFGSIVKSINPVTNEICALIEKVCWHEYDGHNTLHAEATVKVNKAQYDLIYDVVSDQSIHWIGNWQD